MKRKWSKLFSFFRYFRMARIYLGRKLYLFILLNLISVLVESVGLLLFIPFLVQVQLADPDPGRLGRHVYFLFSALGVRPTITSTLLFLVIAFSLKGFTVFLIGAYRGRLLNQARRQIRDNLIASYALLDYQYTTSQSTGFFGNLVVNEVNRAIYSIEGLCRTLTSATTTAILFGVAFALDWKISQFIVLSGLCALLIQRQLSRLTKRYSRQESGLNRTINEFLIEALQSFKYLKSTSGFSRLQVMLEKAHREYAQIQNKRGLASSALEGISEPLLVIFISALVYTHVVLQGQSIAPCVVSIMLFYRCLIEIGYLQRNWQYLCEHVGGLETLYQTTRQLEQYREVTGRSPRWSFHHSIVFRSVSFAYDAQEVLRRLQLRIAKNTSVALVGVSGAGKTTLADLITGILRPTEGEIQVDEMNLSDLDLLNYRKQIGYVTQETIIFADTVASNISLQLGEAPDEQTLEKIRDAARRAHCEEFIQALPRGYDTLVGERGVNLSGGQRQRLAIARELFKEPQILILDEATSSLDSDSEINIQQSLQELKGQMTVILIAHRLSTIRDVDYIYVLDGGSIVEEGTFTDLAGRADGFFHHLCEMQKVV